MAAWALSGLGGKVAVVTGAGRMRSIGRPIAVELARAGCDVVITGTGRSPDRYPDDEKTAGWRDIDSVADEVCALGRRALPLVSDVSDLAAVEALLRQTVAEFGRVDFLINNAGATRGPDRVPVVDMPIDAWDAVLRVNLTGAFLTCRTFGRHLIEQGEGGVIVNISSIAGKMLPPNTSAYAASKAGLQALTACMAQEVGRFQVRVNAICPGIVDTYRVADALSGGVREDLTERRIPIRRVGEGADIANLTLYLCSDQGSWITGQSINVDGGMAVAH